MLQIEKQERKISKSGYFKTFVCQNYQYSRNKKYLKKHTNTPFDPRVQNQSRNALFLMGNRKSHPNVSLNNVKLVFIF